MSNSNRAQILADVAASLAQINATPWTNNRKEISGAIVQAIVAAMDSVVQELINSSLAIYGDYSSVDAPSWINSVPYKITNGNKARTLAQRGTDVANLLEYFVDGDLDYTNAMTRAINTGIPIVVPYNNGTPYTVKGPFVLPANTVIIGLGGVPNFTLAGTTSRLFSIGAVSGVCLGNFNVDGSASGLASQRVIEFDGSTDCLCDNVSLNNCTQGFGLYSGSTFCTISNWSTTNTTMHGVTIDGPTTSNNVVTRGRVSNNVGFGVILQNAGNRNEISFNQCLSNGIELIGVTYLCWGNRIIGNHSQGCGDNGISITGFNNTVDNNFCIGNYHNGIAFYGSSNTFAGNIVKNNGQRFLVDGSLWAGFEFDYNFGGAASNNAGSGNVAMDDQTVATQAYGRRFTGNQYTLWASGASATAGITRCYFGNNVYSAATTGVNGATAPTWTSGTQSDGGVSWTYLFSGTPNLGASGNHLVGTTGSGNFLRATVDTSGNSNTDFGNNAVLTATNNVGPIGLVTGLGGDTVFRRGQSTPYTGMYQNYSGPTTPTNNLWFPVQPRVSEVYTSRLGGSGGLGAGFEGAQQFITDQNRLLIASGASGAGLVDALGLPEKPLVVTATGTNFATAVTLVFAHTLVNVAPAGSGVIIPSNFPGAKFDLWNITTNALNIYPLGTRKINNLSLGAPYVLAAGGKITILNIDNTTYAVG